MAKTDWASLAKRYYGDQFSKAPEYYTQQYMNSTGNNWFGLSKQQNPFSKGNIGGPKGMTAMAAIGQGINLAGTALNKGVTNETGQILSTAGSGLMAIPTPYTMAAGLVLSGAGVIANGLTDRVNTQYQKAKNAEISQIGDWTSGAEDYRGLQQEMSNFGTVDLGDLDNWGDIGFLSSGSNVKGARAKAGRALLAATGMRQQGVNSRGQYINMRNTYNQLGHLTAFGGPIDTVDPSTPIGYSIYTDRAAKDKQKDSAAMTNMFAGTPDMFGFGGGIYTKGANFDTGVSFINTGGTHEENPNDGVPMGVDSQGVPNLVEEGEVRWGDYMFSDRLIVPRGKRGNYGKRARKYAEGGKLVKGKGIDTPYESKVLKPYEGLTFADAAKKILKRNGADERDDAITMRGIDAELSVLAGIQEKEREKEKLREMEETIDNISPEEFAMLQQQMEAQQAAQQQQERAIQQQQMIPEGMEQMVPQEQMAAAYGGPIYELGGLLNNWDIPSTSQDANVFADGGFKDWWEKYINDPVMVNTATDGTDNRLINPDYGALYRAFTGKDDLKLSEEVYNALQKLYETNPEKFTAYDFRTNTFVNSPEKDVESIIENATNSGEIAASPEQEVVLKGEVKGPELLAFNYYNSRHSDKPLTAEQWNALGEREKGRYIKQYKGTLGKDDKIAFDESLTAYNKEQELKDKVAKYQEQQAKSSVNLEDLKDMSYDNLERIAEVVNPNYTKKSLQGLSVDDEKKTIDDLRNNIVEWAKDNEKGTLEYLNKAFGAPEAHNSWARTALDDETRWTPSGYDYDEFKTRTANYNGSQTLGNLAGNYAPDADFDLGEFQDVNALEADQSYKNYTDKVRDAIERNKDVKFRFKEGENPSYAAIEYAEGSPTLSEDDYNTLRLLSRQVERTKTNPNGEYVPIFNIDDNGYRSFNQEITHNNKTYTPWDYFNHLRNDQILGAMHLTPKESKGSELYTLNDKDYYKLSDIEAKTPDWQRYYVEAPETTRLEDGTIVHKLSYQDPLNFARATGTPDDVEVKPDGTYVVKGSGENDPFPRAASWPYAIAAGLQLGSLGYNILKPADYSNADALLSAAKQAGTYTPISPLFAGQRLPYKPAPDTKFGKIVGVGLGNARSIINNSRGNIGATQAGLLQNALNTQLALGEADEAWRQGNWNMLKDVQTFGLQRDTSNYDRDLKAKMSNQDAASRAAGYSLEGQRAAYAMRQAIDDAKANAINVGLSGLANLAYNYAGNKYNQDLLGWGMRHNAWGPGVSYKTSKGGKIRRKRGIGF